jgi:hypothetical protein
MMVEQNRRRLPRVPIALSVHISSFSCGPAPVASVKDINPHGIALETDCEPNLNDDLEVSLSVPYEISLQKHLTIRFRGEVVRDLEDCGKRNGFAARLHRLPERIE